MKEYLEQNIKKPEYSLEKWLWTDSKGKMRNEIQNYLYDLK